MSWTFFFLPLLCFDSKCSLANQVGKAGPSVFSCLVLSLSRFVLILLELEKRKEGKQITSYHGEETTIKSSRLAGCQSHPSPTWPPEQKESPWTSQKFSLF